MCEVSVIKQYLEVANTVMKKTWYTVMKTDIQNCVNTYNMESHYLTELLMYIKGCIEDKERNDILPAQLQDQGKENRSKFYFFGRLNLSATINSLYLDKTMVLDQSIMAYWDIMTHKMYTLNITFIDINIPTDQFFKLCHCAALQFWDIGTVTFRSECEKKTVDSLHLSLSTRQQMGFISDMPKIKCVALCMHLNHTVTKIFFLLIHSQLCFK